jgi:hypothetical protein
VSITDPSTGIPVLSQGMTLHRAQVVLPADTGVAEDAATNTWYFDVADDSALLTAENELFLCYLEFREELSSLIDGAACSIKWYNMEDPPPRTAVREASFPIAVTGSTAAPTEVAVCISFEAPPISGVNQSSRRGRIFVGPLDGGVIGTDGRPETLSLTNFRQGGDLLLTASLLALNWYWCIFSPTRQTFVEVNNGWVDNEFDTQRRRGRDSTARVTFPVGARFQQIATPHEAVPLTQRLSSARG